MAGLTKRDIQLFIEGGFHTVEAVAYTPKMVLERIKGVSEQKATKVLLEGKSVMLLTIEATADATCSCETCAHGLHDRHRDARTPQRTHFYYDRFQAARYVTRRRN
jgi:hypothetical protein